MEKKLLIFTVDSCDELFLSCWFQDFFVFVPCQFDYIVWIFLRFSSLKFVEFLGYVDSSLSSNLGSLRPLFLKILFPCLLLLSSFFGNSPDTYFVCLMVFHWSLSSFFYVFSLCSSAWIILVSLYSSLLITCPACSNLPLDPSSEFLSSAVILN